MTNNDPTNNDSSLNSTIPELPGSGWLAAEPEATPQTHRLRPWGFPTVSPSHPTPDERLSPSMGYNESRWSSARSLESDLGILRKILWLPRSIRNFGQPQARSDPLRFPAVLRHVIMKHASSPPAIAGRPWPCSRGST